MLEANKILLSPSIFYSSEIMQLQSNGWISDNSEIFDIDFDEKNFRSAIGINIGEVFRECIAVTMPTIFFTKWHFDNNESVFEADNFIAASSSEWEQQHPGVHPKLIFLLYAFKWGIRDVHCDDPNCFFATTFAKCSHFKICQNCKRELSSRGEELIPIAYSLEFLLTLNSEKIGDFLGQPLGYALSKFHIQSDCAAVKVKITDKIIDFHALPGSRTRHWLRKTSSEICESKEDILANYIRGALKRRKLKNVSIIASRRWNSWTPAQPHKIEFDGTDYINGSRILGRKTGGGYLISDGQTAIAIDPGYGFLEMLYAFYQIAVWDIDAIVITHDHCDHSAELPNILTLRHVYKDLCSRPLSVFLNPSSFYIYENLLSYYKPILASDAPRKIQPNEKYNFHKMTISTIDMLHEEMVDYINDPLKGKIQSSALGIKIEGESEYISRKRFNVAILGDTAFPGDTGTCEKLLNFFGKPDIAAIHLGSIEKEWITVDAERASEIEYDRGDLGKGKHLGINGCAKAISMLQPSLSVITEFGEELDSKSHRRTITDIIKRFVQNSQSIVLPSDIGLLMALDGDDIFCRCMNCGMYVPASAIQVAERDGYLYYHYDTGCDTGLEHRSL